MAQVFSVVVTISFVQQTCRMLTDSGAGRKEQPLLVMGIWE